MSVALVAYVDRASGTVTLDPYVQIPGKLGGPSEMYLLYISRNGAPTGEAREQAARLREAGWHVNVRRAPVPSRPVITTPTQPVRSRAVISDPELVARTATAVALVGSAARAQARVPIETRGPSRASLATRRQHKRRRRCLTCGIERDPMTMGRHLKRHGHVGWEAVDMEPAG